jgi:1,2-phenylacetyl-CoA epoxidase catalytic subunit
MGLDDIGHSRVLYGSLKELGSPDADAGTEAVYNNVPYLDRPWTEWAQFVAANAVLDGAFTLMIEALAGGDVEVLRSRLKKMLQEEQYHYLHGRSWMRETNAAEAVRAAWVEAITWFGPQGGDVDQLHDDGKLGMGVRDLLRRLEERLEAKPPASSIEWKSWDPIRRRTAGGGIDQLTLEMLQGLAEKRYMPASG